MMDAEQPEEVSRVNLQETTRGRVDVEPVVVGHRRRGAREENLGLLVRGLRKKGHLTQVEFAEKVAAMLGKPVEQPLIARLEAGIHRPKLEEIRAILDVARIDPIEESRVLYTAGYLPTKEDLEKNKSSFDVLLKDWSERGLPCAVIDAMGWRYVAWNEEADKLFHLSQAQKRKEQKGITGNEEDELYGYPQLLELILDPSSDFHKLVFSAGKEAGMNFAAQQLNNFFYQTEPWRRLPWLNRMKEDIRKTPYYSEIALLRRQHLLTSVWISYGFTEIPIIHESEKRILAEFSTELNTDFRFETLRYLFFLPRGQ
ncbi:helix-turn-helix domain-containing protein [Candidatus Daviesbacteria bacterium]|nr:helix-turn-helix domain-containing protein [Candidatus Daviesbacteria bacterium]